MIFRFGLASLLLTTGCSSNDAHSNGQPPPVAAAAAAGSADSAGLPGAPGSAGSSSAASAGLGGATSTAAGVAGMAGAPVDASSAGASGAGASSAGAEADGGAATPCHPRPGQLFCEDFESSALGSPATAPWSTGLNGDGTVTVESSAFAHSGKRSVHVHGSGYQSLLVYHDTAVLPQSSGKFYMRAFVRLAESMTGGHNTFLVADTFAAPGAGNSARLGEANSMLIMTVGGDAHGYNSNPNYYNDMLPGVVFPAEEYSCLEMLFDAAASDIQVWVENKDVPGLHASNLAHENYDTLRFGFEKYTGPVSDIWYDDIAIGTEQLGCD